MSLIILRKFEDKFFAIADTRISYEIGNILPEDKRLFNNGSLKLIILRPSILVAYAGDPECAENTIDKILDTDCSDINEIIAILHKAHISHKEITDFALVYIDVYGQIVMYEFSHSQVTGPVDCITLGHNPSFECFQKSFLDDTTFQSNSVVAPGINEYEILHTRIMKAFQDVLVNAELREVGDFFISAYLERSFRPNEDWLLYSDLFTHAQGMPITIEASTEWTKIPQKMSAADGSYTISYHRYQSSDAQGILIYIHEISVGYFFHPLLGLEPEVIRNKTVKECKKLIDCKLADK